MIYMQSLSHGELQNLRNDMYPSALYGHTAGLSEFSEAGSHYFGFLLDGFLTISRPGLHPVPISAGMYFSLSGPFSMEGKGAAAVFQRLGFRGLNQWGGPVEEHGRLCYIDNCRASLLVSPPRMGDPCLNLLTFPPDTTQTIHIHPTLRLGLVYRGNGICRLQDGREIALQEGTVFFLPSGFPHSFVTKKSAMSVIAYHPDTDLGPTDSSHPMLSRTYTKF